MLDLVHTKLNMPIIIRYYFCLLAIEKVLAIEADKQTNLDFLFRNFEIETKIISLSLCVIILWLNPRPVLLLNSFVNDG
jgi:hypothetical protein